VQVGQCLTGVADPQPEALGAELPSDDLHQRLVGLDHHLRRSWTGRGDPAGQGAAAATEVDDGQRFARLTDAVDDVGEQPDVLELEVRRVVEVDGGLGGPVHHQLPAARPVQVAGQIGRAEPHGPAATGRGGWARGHRIIVQVQNRAS
jgi:hypothetical protein